MRGYMFRNRWWALIFAGLVLAGATRLVGTGHGDGALEQAIQEVAAQREAAETWSDGGAADPVREVIELGLVPDEELIDQTLGEDPIPMDPALGIEPEVVSEEQVVIVPLDVEEP